ncbi:MAG: hypothetical protein QW478_13475 [Candidatus Micrarchaeaceae archaeon]
MVTEPAAPDVAAYTGKYIRMSYVFVFWYTVPLTGDSPRSVE